MPLRLPTWRRADPAHAAPTPAAPAEPRAPGPLRLLLENRAPWEYVALRAAEPWLRRLPAGDGHAVVVFPGLGANDLSTAPLRRLLGRLGHPASGWGLGFNFGPRPGVLDACRVLLRDAAARSGRPVSLIGWSLGGLYARELAKEQPALVRCVITLGSPFAGPARATNAWRFYRLVRGRGGVDDDAVRPQLHLPPPVPTTSIYSRSDGIVAWQCSLNPSLPRVENVEVHASHVGMGMNPLAVYVIADRLRQDPAHWQPFDRGGTRRWFYRHAHGDAPPAAAEPRAAPAAATATATATASART